MFINLLVYDMLLIPHGLLQSLVLFRQSIERLLCDEIRALREFEGVDVDPFGFLEVVELAAEHVGLHEVVDRYRYPYAWSALKLADKY